MVLRQSTTHGSVWKAMPYLVVRAVVQVVLQYRTDPRPAVLIMILVRSTNLITQLVNLEHLVARFLEIHTPSHRSPLPERPAVRLACRPTSRPLPPRRRRRRPATDCVHVPDFHRRWHFQWAGVAPRLPWCAASAQRDAWPARASRSVPALRCCTELPTSTSTRRRRD